MSNDCAYYTFHLGNNPFWSRLLSYWINSVFLANDGAIPIVVSTDIKRDDLNIITDAFDVLTLCSPDLDRVSLELGYHDGINDMGFETLCYQRWLCALDILDELGLNRLFHLDNDLLLTNFIKGSQIFTPLNIEGVHSVHEQGTYCSSWDKVSLNQFKDCLEEYFDYCNSVHPKRSSDMQYMGWLINRKKVKYYEFNAEDGLNYISNFRRFLLENIPPLTKPPEVENHHQMDGSILMKHWPTNYVWDFISILSDEKILPILDKIEFVHFQGLAKAVYSDPNNNLYALLVDRLKKGKYVNATGN